MEFKVLIVDDDKEIRDMLSSMFMDWADEQDVELDIREYECGNECVEDLDEDKWVPDISSVDFMMDNGDGVLVVTKLRELSESMPILVVTAWAEAEGFKTIVNECIIVSKTDINIIDEAISQELSELKNKNE
jgi:CheY-like chemotaxis protein